MIVQFTPQVEDYLFDLIEILHQKGYFSFYDTAEKYVMKLLEDIESNIHIKQKKKAPVRFQKYASYYITYRPNKRTTWYIFFNVKDDRYLIRYITNSHVSAQHIRGL